MGTCYSTSRGYHRMTQDNNICNYHCPVCKQSGKLPNIKGKFFLIDEFNCKCNGCNTVFDKFVYYKHIPPIVEGVLEVDPIVETEIEIESIPNDIHPKNDNHPIHDKQ